MKGEGKGEGGKTGEVIRKGKGREEKEEGKGSGKEQLLKA